MSWSTLTCVHRIARELHLSSAHKSFRGVCEDPQRTVVAASRNLVSDVMESCLQESRQKSHFSAMRLLENLSMQHCGRQLTASKFGATCAPSSLTALKGMRSLDTSTFMYVRVWYVAGCGSSGVISYGRRHPQTSPTANAGPGLLTFVRRTTQHMRRCTERHEQ